MLGAKGQRKNRSTIPKEEKLLIFQLRAEEPHGNKHCELSLEFQLQEKYIFTLIKVRPLNFEIILMADNNLLK